MNKFKQWKINFGMFLFKHRTITPIPILIAVFLFLPPGDLGRRNVIISVAGLIVSLLGEMIRVMTVGYSQTGTSGRESYLKADFLNMDGIYSLVRNPLYLGNYLIFSGLTIVFCNIWAMVIFTLFFIFQYYFIILNEQSYLMKQHGEQYIEYKKKVPAIVPRVSGYQKPTRPFNLKKVILKENDSIFNIGVMFLLVLLFREFILNNRIISNWTPYIVSGSILAVIYILIKIFKKRMR